MLIDIDKIRVENRIRKDFGDINELAEDIKQNGLINPPVVTAENDGTFTLLAGERRLRAMRSLGYNQVEVRTWGSLTDEQKLNIEISENEVRKDFSKSERICYARRLEKIESLKAKDRKLATQNNNSARADKENFPALVSGQSRDIVAEKVGIGSGKQYEREKYITDNQDYLTPEDFADWDEGKLSTNKAYLKIKAQLVEKENQIAGYEKKLEQIGTLKTEISTLKQQLSEKESSPSDYDEIKTRMNDYKADYQRVSRELQEKVEQLNNVKLQLEEALNPQSKTQFNKRVNTTALNLAVNITNFIRENGGLCWITDYIDNITPQEKTAYLNSLNALDGWVQIMKENIIMKEN